MRRVAYAYMTGRCVRVASRRVASHFLWPRIAPLLSVRPFKSVRSMCPHTHHISRTPFFSRSESVTHPNPSHCPRLVRPTTNLPTYRHTLATASRSTLAPTSCCCCFCAASSLLLSSNPMRRVSVRTPIQLARSGACVFASIWSS